MALLGFELLLPVCFSLPSFHLYLQNAMFRKALCIDKSSSTKQKYHEELNHHLNPFTNWFGVLHITNTCMKDFLILSLIKPDF